MRDKCVHIRLSRGSEYSSWASSTARRASYVCACVAKMSRISSVRSSTFTPTAFSRLRVWPGTQVVVEDHHVRLVRRHQPDELLDLAAPQIGGGVRRLATLRHPADHPRAGRRGQPFQFLQGILLKSLVGKYDSDQHRGLTGHTLGAFSFVHSGVQPPRWESTIGAPIAMTPCLRVHSNSAAAALLRRVTSFVAGRRLLPTTASTRRASSI